MVRKIVIGTFVVLGLAALILSRFDGASWTPPSEGPLVQMLSQFPGKIVYTANASLDPAPFEADCKKRGGVFSSCGSICAPDAAVCAAVCALTCENIPTQ